MLAQRSRAYKGLTGGWGKAEETRKWSGADGGEGAGDLGEDGVAVLGVGVVVGHVGVVGELGGGPAHRVSALAVALADAAEDGDEAAAPIRAPVWATAVPELAED